MLDTHYLIQLDTMIRNGRVTAGTAEFLDALDQAQIPYTIVTEQSGRTREQIASALNAAGLINVRAEEIYTSSMAAVDYAYHRDMNAREAFVCGGRGIAELIDRTGFHHNYTHPDYVFFGLDRELGYLDYSDVLQMICDGALLLSTDSRLQQKSDGRMRIGSGALVNMLETASGKDAVHFGRGSELLYRWLLKYIGKTAADVTAVGNEFERDIVSAARMGFRTVLVADEDTDAEKMMTSRIHPDYIVESLEGLTR